MKKRIMILAFTVAACACFLFSSMAAEKKPYQQNDYAGSSWAGVYYDGGSTGVAGGAYFGESGCGIMSTVNAINYVNGVFIDPIEMADWAYSIGGFSGATGCYNAIVWPNLEAKFGEQYHFKVDNDGTWGNAYNATLQNHCANGGVAVANVYNHFIALVSFNPATQQFLVYDSYMDRSRPTSTSGSWISVPDLAGNYWALNVFWFCLISSTDHTDPTFETPRVVGMSEDGYTVACEVDDDVSIDKVYFPTWTEYNHQDDLKWYQASIVDNTAYATIPKSEHNGEMGPYITHMYVYDGTGNYVKYEFDEIMLTDLVGEQTIEDGVYYLHSKDNDSTVMAVEDGSLDNGANLCLKQEEKTDAQAFRFIYKEKSGTYEIVNVGSGKSIDVSNGAKYPNVNLWQYERNDTAAQRWIVHQEEDGYYTLTSLASGALIDAEGGRAGDGVNLFLCMDNGGDNQRWRIAPFGHTVTYDFDDEQTAMVKESIPYDTQGTVIEQAPTRRGFSLLGWADTQKAEVPVFHAGDPLTLSQNTTLYAVWKPVTQIYGEAQCSLTDGVTGTISLYHIPDNARVIVAAYNCKGQMIAVKTTELKSGDISVEAPITCGSLVAMAWAKDGSVKPVVAATDIQVPPYCGEIPE